MKTLLFRCSSILLLMAVTLTAQSKNALAGNYPVGSSAEIKTLTAAVELLKNNGVSDSVIFNIEAGIYNESITIPAISGASAHNRIIFRGVNQENSLLQYNATPASNWLLKLDGADHLSFENLSMQALNSTYARVIVLTNGADSNSFKNNRITGIPVTTYDSDHLKTLVYSASLNATKLDQGNSFEQNIFIDGNMALNLGGINAVTPFEQGYRIRNNVFQNQFSKAIYINYQNQLSITGNSFISASNYNSYYAIDCFRADSSLVIANNRLDLNTQNSAYGIALRPAKAGSMQPALIYNNFISLNQTGSGALYGIYLDNCEYNKVFYNSVKISGSSPNSIALYIYRKTINSEIMNNLLINQAGGLASRASSQATGDKVNYNNLYSSGSSLASWGATPAAGLSDWQTASGFDSLSFNQNVEFAGTADLHLMNQSVKAGIPLSEFLTDIDGDLRDSVSTNIGADEYTDPSEIANIPSSSDLKLACYPNPFNPATTISYQLSSISEVRLMVYNAKGEMVKLMDNGMQNAGKHSVSFDATGLNSGVYFYKLEAGGNSAVNKVILIK